MKLRSNLAIDRRDKARRQFERQTEARRHDQARHNQERNTTMTPIERAREAQRRIKALSTQIQTAINGLDSTVTRARAEAAEDRALGRPEASERDRYNRTEQSKRTLSATVRGAGERLANLQGELARALAEADSGAVASESARTSVRTQLQAGVPASSILEDAAARYDVDVVRAVRQEVGGFVMASAGSNETARELARQGRERVEFEADRVLARIGTEPEQDIAKLRLGSAVMIDSARHLAEKAGQVAGRGELRPEDRMSLAYAQADQERATAQQGAA